MKAGGVAALTMVYRSPVLLAKWVAHYGRELGRAHLTVVSHGPDADHATIAAGCNLLTVPRAFTDTFSQDKSAFLSAMAAALLRVYRAVVVTDVDELVLADPALAPGLAARILDGAGSGVAALAPPAWNLMPDPAAMTRPLDWSRPLLGQVNRMVPTFVFTKPQVLYRPARLTAGGHGLSGADFAIDPGLVMLHLRYADRVIWSAHYEALREELAEVRRRARPSGGARGKISGHWARGAGYNEVQIRRFAGFREVPVREPAEVAAELMRVGQGGSARVRRVVSAKDGGRSDAGLAPMALPERFLALA